MAARNAINDGAARAPRLELQQSWWAMIGLGENGKEWDMERKFEKIAEAGFSAISASIPAPEEEENWLRLLERYKLGFSAMAFPSSVNAYRETLAAAARMGCVQYVNLQVMDSFVCGDAATGLLSGLLRAADEAAIPTFVEKHRGTVTQDLIRTVRYTRALRELRLTIDLSHYVVAGELNGPPDKAESRFDELLARTSVIHGRVSNGEQVQVDIGAEGDHPMLERFARWWRKGMACWLEQAQPGDVLPFVTELGPPGYYAITQRDAGGREREISDRWQQALLLKRIAEEQWRQALSDRP
ncbi:sugar phosphate isomerase/epimerase [Cohnella nanjingensis]|uniref:Sugar phosphate isomerase/epimerase n=1 Tax=Cohnella nanjingensis TaxID=1387779 RepID=A0A7X0RQM6_9BACL|nr:sugar phosphate isomerase/epimerase [Cohnella nanjingensis]MBB6670696.1 sugar phosphate isomerase/epimerase [Cohnella nanjingensis]